MMNVGKKKPVNLEFYIVNILHIQKKIAFKNGDDNKWFLWTN